MVAALTELKIKSGRQIEDSFKMLDNMRRKGELCDITLVVGNVEILAHRIVLASCSPCFYSMFINTVDASRERIELDGDPQIFLSVINYMYTSELTVHEHNLKNLLNIAKMLFMDNLQNECCRLLEQVLNPNNCFDIKTMANACQNSELLISTLHYVDANITDIVATEGFLNVTNVELVDLISRDTLQVPSEEKVYECVVNWIGHNPKGRRKYLRPLMECVRLQFISKVYLKQRIVKGPFLRGDSHCKDLIINALLDDPNSPLEAKPRQGYEKILLVVGGDGEAKQSLEYFDLTTKKWTKAEIPFGVHSACSIAANQKVYVLGGETKEKTMNSVYLYDIVANSWHEVNGMIVKRDSFGVAVLNNCIYAVGGWDGTPLNCAERFNLDTQEWSSIAPMLTSRYWLGVCVLNDMLYAIGGHNDDEALKSVECYDYHTNSWKQLSSMNEKRSGVGVCALDGKICAIGGHNDNEHVRTAEVYDPKIDSWTQISSTSVPRMRTGIAINNNQIYVVGGNALEYVNGKYKEKVFNSVEIYDKQSDSWTTMPEVMGVARSGHAVAITDKIAKCTFSQEIQR